MKAQLHNVNGVLKYSPGATAINLHACDEHLNHRLLDFSRRTSRGLAGGGGSDMKSIAQQNTRTIIPVSGTAPPHRKGRVSDRPVTSQRLDVEARPVSSVRPSTK